MTNTGYRDLLTIARELEQAGSAHSPLMKEAALAIKSELCGASIPTTVEEVKVAEIEQANAEVRRLRLAMTKAIQDMDLLTLRDALESDENIPLRPEWDPYNERNQ